MSSRTCAAALLAAVVAASGLTGCGDDEPGARATPSPVTSTAPAGTGSSSASPAPAPSFEAIVVSVAGGKVTNGINSTQRVSVGETVRLQVTSDERDEVHVHGYDLVVQVGPGLPGTVEFEATMPGQWRVELHEAGTELFTLAVG